MDGLLERDAHLDELGAVLRCARDGQGRLAVITGPAGSGKSTLLAALAERAPAAGHRVLRARGSELERELSFGAIRQLFETTIASAAPPEREQLLAGAAAPAAWVVAPDVDRGAAQVRADAGFGALHGIYWLATNLSLVSPLLLVVDDLHWVDTASVGALDYLARRIGDLPIALVVALRPDEPGGPAAHLDELRDEPEAVAIALSPLHRSSVAAIVRRAVPSADEALCAACFTASAGNPFYLQELLRAIAGHGNGTRNGDLAAAVRAAAVPAVGDRVARRLARVGPAAPALARAMAVLGDGSRLADAAALAGLHESVAADAARRLVRIDVLTGKDPVAFVHPLVRRSIYDMLSVTERDAAHTAAAVLRRRAGASAEAVAAHLVAVRPKRSAAVATALREAAQESLARAAPDAAYATLRRALDEGAPEPARGVLLFELGQTAMLRRDPAAVGHLEAALAVVEDPSLRARIALGMAEIFIAMGRWEDGVRVISEALENLDGADPELAVDLETFRAMVGAHDPRHVAGFERDRPLLDRLARGEGWASRALSALLAANLSARGAAHDDVVALVEHGLRDGVLVSARASGGWALVQAVVALVQVEADERALALCMEIGAQARRSGAVLGALAADGMWGWVHSRQGDLIAAEAALRMPLELVTQQGLFLDIASGFWFLRDALLERPALGRSALALALPAGAREEALALAGEEVALAAAIGRPRPHGVALRAAGILAGGEAGVAQLRESVALLAASAARLEHARSLVELGAALRRLGRRAAAREPLADGMDLARRCGADRVVARARDELRAAGARPRRIERTGVEALTPSEQRVARLVAGGHSNPEVAQELFVSLKTVETHLSHAYAKLGLSGPGARRGVADALERAPEPTVPAPASA